MDKRFRKVPAWLGRSETTFLEALGPKRRPRPNATLSAADLADVAVTAPLNVQFCIDARAVTKKGGETEACMGCVIPQRPYRSLCARSLRTFSIHAGGDDAKDVEANFKVSRKGLKHIIERGLDVRKGSCVGEAFKTDKALGFKADELFPDPDVQGTDSDSGSNSEDDEKEILKALRELRKQRISELAKTSKENLQKQCINLDVDASGVKAELVRRLTWAELGSDSEDSQDGRGRGGKFDAAADSVAARGPTVRSASRGARVHAGRAGAARACASRAKGRQSTALSSEERASKRNTLIQSLSQHSCAVLRQKAATEGHTFPIRCTKGTISHWLAMNEFPSPEPSDSSESASLIGDEDATIDAQRAAMVASLIANHTQAQLAAMSKQRKGPKLGAKSGLAGWIANCDIPSPPLPSEADEDEDEAEDAVDEDEAEDADDEDEDPASGSVQQPERQLEAEFQRTQPEVTETPPPPLTTGCG